MDVGTLRRVTAQVKIFKPDGRVIVRDVEMDPETLEEFLAHGLEMESAQNG